MKTRWCAGLQVREFVAHARRGDGYAVSPLFLLAQLANMATFCSCSGWGLEQGLTQAREMSSGWQTTLAVAADGLERCLRRDGFDPLLTATELRTLPLLLAGGASWLLAQEAQNDGRDQRAWELAAQGTDAFRELVALHPDWPVMKVQHSLCLQLGRPSQQAAAVAAARDAFRQADASTGMCLARPDRRLLCSA